MSGNTHKKNKNKTCTVNAYERVRGVLSQLGERERVGKIVRVLRGKYLIKELIDLKWTSIHSLLGQRKLAPKSILLGLPQLWKNRFLWSNKLPFSRRKQTVRQTQIDIPALPLLSCVNLDNCITSLHL